MIFNERRMDVDIVIPMFGALVFHFWRKRKRDRTLCARVNEFEREHRTMLAMIPMAGTSDRPGGPSIIASLKPKCW